jgi:hypothetical protein
MNLNEFLETLQKQGHLKIKVGPNSENEDTRELPLLVVDVCNEYGEVILDISAMTAERLAILVEEKNPKTYLDGNLDASDYQVSIRDGEKSEEVFGILKINAVLLVGGTVQLPEE